MAFNDKMEKLSRALECSICLEQFSSPRLLPCLHSFCEKCLAQHMAETEEKGKFHCPLCKAMYNVPKEGVTDFKRNIYLLDIIEIFPDKTCVTCDVCKIDGQDVQASSMCIQCRDFLCQQCDKFHCGTRLTKTHNVVDLERVRTGQYVDELRRHQKVYCAAHENKELEIYCEKCEVPVCLLCNTFDHNQHKVTDLRVAATKATHVMNKLLERWSEVTQHCEMLLEKKRENFEGLEQHRKACESEIKRVYSEFLAEIAGQVKSHQEKAIEQLNEQVAATKKQAQAACDEAELNRGKFVSVLQYVNSVLASAHDAEKLQQFREIRKRLENLDVDQIETQVKQTTFEVQPKKLVIPNLGLKVVPKLGNENISSKFSHKIATKVAVSCKSPVHHMTPQPAVKEPAQLQRRFRSQREGERVGGWGCSGLAVGDGVLIVTNRYNTKVKVFDKNTLTFKFELEQTRQKLQDPVDMTTNVHGDIFITDWNIHGVVKYNAEGRVVKVYPNVYKGGGYITCHTNKLIVVDTAGGRVIFTDYNCKVHHQIDARTLRLSRFSPKHICTDENTGHLVVSEWDPGRVHVIDCTRSAVINTYTPKLSNVLQGVCVDQFGYTLVVDSSNHQVILFTNARAHVLIPWGGVFRPTGVCVSAPGEVSVLQRDGEVKVFKYLDI